jgi:hypothetical protein
MVIFYFFEQIDGVQYISFSVCFDVDFSWYWSSGSDIYGVEVSHFVFYVGDVFIAGQFYAAVNYSSYFGVNDPSGQSIGWNAISHHAAGFNVAFVDGDLVSVFAEEVGGTESTWPSSDYQDFFAGWSGSGIDLPIIDDGEVSDGSFQQIYINGAIEFTTIASFFAGMIAGASHGGREWIILHDYIPGFKKFFFLD